MKTIADILPYFDADVQAELSLLYFEDTELNQDILNKLYNENGFSVMLLSLLTTEQYRFYASLDVPNDILQDEDYKQFLRKQELQKIRYLQNAKLINLLS